MNATHIFEELIQNHGYKFSPKHFGKKMMSLRMSSLDFPVSISANEFNFMSEFVEENNLKRGYEVATGTGVSALAIGLGMKNGGKLVSMDSYIEENLGLDYNDEDKEVFVESRGAESVNRLVEKFGLTDVVFTKAGWSPDDTEKCIREVFNDPLDFVFIDALHDDKHFIQDIQAVVPLLADKFAIFMHDTHCLGKKSKNFLMDTFGKIWTYAENCRYPMGGWNLGYIENVVPKSAGLKRIRV
tara:strand:- start:236 stop:961 length:726 start_codon:yes stop_codon:yes gene_type:complete